MGWLENLYPHCHLLHWMKFALIPIDRRSRYIQICNCPYASRWFYSDICNCTKKRSCILLQSVFFIDKWCSCLHNCKPVPLWINCYISDSSLHATCCKMVTAAHDRISPLTASPQHRFANPGFWPQQTAVSRLALPFRHGWSTPLRHKVTFNIQNPFKYLK